MNAEKLYFLCIERIDDDIDVAEDFLVGCITYLKKAFYGRAERERVEHNLSISHYEPYERELTLIVNMEDDSLSSLIASSVDLSTILKKVTIIFEKIQDADFNQTQMNVHASKAKRSGDMLLKIAGKMKKLKKPKKETTLFGGEDG